MIMEEMTLDYLKGHPELKLFQRKDMFRINTDTCLLGEFMEIEKDDLVLDVGTNNGALLIYASKKTSKKVYGIDINEEALILAHKNMELHKIDAKLILQDFSYYQSDIKFDVIICNPPFFNTKDNNSKNSNKHLLIARHEDYLKLNNLVNSIDNNLSNDGRVFLVHRPNRLDEIKKNFLLKKMYITKICHVVDVRINKEVTILLKVERKKKEVYEYSIKIN